MGELPKFSEENQGIIKQSDVSELLGLIRANNLSRGPIICELLRTGRKEDLYNLFVEGGVFIDNYTVARLVKDLDLDVEKGEAGEFVRGVYEVFAKLEFMIPLDAENPEDFETFVQGEVDSVLEIITLNQLVE